MEKMESKFCTVILDVDFLPQSVAAADAAVQNSQRDRLQREEAVSTEWSIDDHLLALRSRMDPLRVLARDLYSAALCAHSAVWPEQPPCASTRDLALTLWGTGDRLREWRHSCARAGADEALAWVLSWYENINLDVLVEARGGSRWLSDPDMIARRMTRAHAIAEWADVSDAEDEEEEEAQPAGSEAEYADSGVAGDGEEPVDEEIQAEAPPSDAVPESETQADTAPETQTDAPETGPEAEAASTEPQATAETAAPDGQTGATDPAAQTTADAAAMNPDAAA